MPKQQAKNAQLLVEGKNDQHVVWALCERHEVDETFDVVVPSADKDGPRGIDALLESIPVRLKISGLRALGIVADANEDLQGRWQAICTRLQRAGYDVLPQQRDANGCIISPPGKPKVGVWLMPDNRLPGMLENFVARLIPDDDPLAPRAETCLQEIEQDSLNRYALVHHPKAFIHTWLAWQKNPGMPMGQAITAHVLNHETPLAAAFVDWLNRLFALRDGLGDS